MSETARLRFLPWLRAGAAQAISSGDADALSGNLAANAMLTPWVQINEFPPIEQTANLRGPGHVTALGAQTIMKVEPPDGTQDFENNYFPFVELQPADLPWRFTPASPGTNNQLRPWLVLVVVRQQTGVSIVSEPNAKLPVLRIEAPATPSMELPDLSDSSAWAHVQTTLPPSELTDALKTDASAAVARLMCPRYLEPNAAWIACLVPAFDVGRYAGLGEDGATATEAHPAWDHTNPETLDETVVRLPVYHRWMFSTGPSGDFESLARRLEAEDGSTTLGRVDLDVTNPGPPLPDPPNRTRIMADFVGALRSPGIERRDIPREHRQWLDKKLEEVLEHGAQQFPIRAEAPANYDPATDDPVVAPPLYSSFQADRYDVPDDRDPKRAWMRPLNLMPEYRAIAGLGAAVVRKNQEALMASAWAQAGAFRDAQRLFDQGRLAAEIGRSLARRMRSWEFGALMQATQRIHAWITSPASPNKLAVDLNSTALPSALVGSAFARATRPRSPLGRAFTARTTRQNRRPIALSAATKTFLSVTASNATASDRLVLDFAKTSLPAGAWTQDPSLENIVNFLSTRTAVGQTSARPPRVTISASRALPFDKIIGPNGDRFDGTLAGAITMGRDLLDVLTRISDIPMPLRDVLDLSTASTSVLTQIDPLRSIQDVLVTRIPALSGLMTADLALPSRLVLQPIFTDPLYEDVVRLDSRYLLPGADTLRNNKVALLEADDDFVAAFLAGANHEMSRELIWREFPTSPRHTFFRRFWDTGATGPDDSGDISHWKNAILGRNLSGITADALTIILVRGDLVRRYPNAHVYLRKGEWQHGEVVPTGNHLSEPLMQGMIDRRTAFYGFPVNTDDLRGNRMQRSSGRTATGAGWFVTIEEPSQGPRFGLDLPADEDSDLQTGATTWSELSWGHLVGDSLTDPHFAVARTSLPVRNAVPGRLSWGHNSAHMAAITWQRPFRLYIHADRLLGEPI